MQILVPVGDLVSAGGAPAAFFGLIMPRHPEIEFLWPSRGPDLRLRRLGLLPPNAEPFAVDRSSELRQIAATFAADETELPYAEWVVAAAAALQGIVLQAVDVPSLLPVAHLIRPVFGAMGVGVRRVVECWMGSASESWPDMLGPSRKVNGSIVSRRWRGDRPRRQSCATTLSRLRRSQPTDQRSLCR